jgi:hypothetical protein
MQVGEGRCHHHQTTGAFYFPQHSLGEFNPFLEGRIHFPVSGNYLLTHKNYFFLIVIMTNWAKERAAQVLLVLNHLFFASKVQYRTE